MGITDEDVYQSFKQFYNQGINGKDMLRDKGTSDYRNWGIKEYVEKAKEQPVKFFGKRYRMYDYEVKEKEKHFDLYCNCVCNGNHYSAACC